MYYRYFKLRLDALISFSMICLTFKYAEYISSVNATLEKCATKMRTDVIHVMYKARTYKDNTQKQFLLCITTVPPGSQWVS